MDSLSKLTDDILTAIDGISNHVSSVLNEVFTDTNEPTNSDTRKSDESEPGSSQETTSERRTETTSLP